MAQWTALDSQVRNASRWAALLAALTAGLAIGCPLERNLSCGDGWWDPEFEDCDPRDPDMAHVNACRDQGYVVDATCDPTSCTIRASEEDCTVCGDGIASGDEQCDRNDLRGETCSAGGGLLRCRDDCTLDYSECPALCGDGVVSGLEECEPSLSCADNDDCPEGMVCYDLFGQCVAVGDNFAPNLSCSAYSNKTIGSGDKKPYTSGTIERCTDGCFFGRNNCGFCGDGELDEIYSDLVYPTGEPAPFPAEVCDGDEADHGLLAAHCKPLCTSDAVNGDVDILCNFECNAGCTDFAEVTDIFTPEGLGCCLAAGSPCVPNENQIEGVPDLPCCSWLDNPTWLEERKCVVEETNTIPITWECPG